MDFTKTILKLFGKIPPKMIVPQIEGDAQVQISEIEELFSGLNEIATSFVSSLFLITILEIILRFSAAMISIIALRRRNLRNKKEIAKKTGRSVKDIRTDILDDGEINYSAGDDVNQMQEVLDAVDSLLQEDI